MTPTDRFFTSLDIRERAALSREIGNEDRARALDAVAAELRRAKAGDMIATDHAGRIAAAYVIPENGTVWGVVYHRLGVPVLLVSSPLLTEEHDG